MTCLTDLYFGNFILYDSFGKWCCFPTGFEIRSNRGLCGTEIPTISLPDEGNRNNFRNLVARTEIGGRYKSSHHR
jgi:hypothetical protein